MSVSEMERRHRTNLIFGGIGVILFAVLVVGFIGMLTNIAPTPSPSGYSSDGSLFVTPPPMATVWLTVILTDLVAIFALGLFSAGQNQQ